MNNQWKMVPVEPTPEMYAAASTDSWEQGLLGAGYKAMLTAAPVPPAGDVEVLGYVSFVGKDHVRVTLDCHAPTLNTQVVNRVYATQLEADCQALQSERDGLLAKLETMRRKNNELNDTEARLQSELTKARELLTDVKEFLAYPDANLMDEVNAFLSTPIAHNVDESCGQDAEAAKGERS